MSNKGVVTQYEIMEKDASKGIIDHTVYLKTAIETTEKLIDVAKKYNSLSKDFKGAKTSKDILDLKAKELTISQKQVDLQTKQSRSELEILKIKEKNIVIAQKNTDLQTKQIKTDLEHQKIKEKDIVISQKQIDLISKEAKAEVEILKIKEKEIAIETKKVALKHKIENQKKRGIVLSADEKLVLRQKNKQLAEEAILMSPLIGAYQKLNLKRTQAKKKLQDLIASEKASTFELKKAQKAFDKYDKKVRQADKAVGDFTKNVGNYKSAFGGLTKSVRGLIGAFGFTSGIMIFSSLVKGAFNRIREFDKSMQNLSGILRVNRTDLSDLEQTIISVAGSSVKTSNEVAKLAETLITLGKSKEEVKSLLKPVVDLGIGLDTTGEEAGEFLVQMLNTFGASTQEAGKYADTIATIRTSTSLDFQKMRDSFQYLAPISKALNKDLAYTGSLVGILADNGIKAERAGRLMGTSQQKLESEGKSLNDALIELNDAKSKNVSELELLALSSKLFGKQSSALGLVLANNTDLIEKNAQAIRDNGGALKDLVDGQLKSVDAKLKILDSSWEELILTIENGEGKLSSAFKGFIETLTFAIQKTTELEKAQSKLAKIGVEKNGWRSFFDTVLPGLSLLGSGYDDAEKAQLKFNKTNEGIEKNGISILNSMRDQLFAKVRLNKISEEEQKVYLNQIKVIEATIEKKREERYALEKNAIALGFNKKELGKYSDFIGDYTDGDLRKYIDANKESTDVINKKTNVQKELTKEQIKAAKILAKKRKQLNESLKKSKFELIQDELNSEIDKQQKITTNENKSLQERFLSNVILGQNLRSLNLEIIREDKRILKESLDAKTISQEEYYVRLQILRIKAKGLEEDVQKKLTDNLEGTLENRIDAEKLALDKNLENFKLKKEVELKIQKETEEQKRQIIGETSDFIANALGLDSNNVQKLMSGLLDGFENFSEGLTASLSVAGDVMNSLTNISANFSQARIDEIDNEIEKNDEKFNKLLENEELTLEQRSLLETQKQVEQDKLEEKKRKEKNKQAKLEKANTLVQIALQTSLGVISALAQVPKIDFGISALALASVIGGIGAVQFALAAAQPIPKFAKGTKNAPKGWAIVDEIGAEIHADKKGNIKSYGNDSGANYRYLEQGDQIIPHNESKDLQKRFAQLTLNDINYQNQRVTKAQQITANDGRVNEVLLASMIAKELSKQSNSNISKEIKKGFKNVKVNATFTNNSGTNIYNSKNDWK